jgi:hypothetical protein
VAFEIKRNDREPVYEIPLRHRIGDPTLPAEDRVTGVPIPGLDTVSAIWFIMRQENQVGPPKVMQEAELVDVDDSRVRYSWAEGDTDTEGNFQVEFEIEKTPGVTETVPNKGFFSVIINPDLGEPAP